uniref:Uncharacterized protein n=1 Tax=Hanusia phi TaxID=3032 RepID=A0A7S0NEP3_9CRYP|mmetsp:Transcript_8106/g.18519  ORF Transcript_8106/g.18519 Transcript_8106/m.18519 type:complete len:129 (+) Transcript_8106:154-540(+)|eukprot:511440-Hanusia_phi.AAC.1
MAFSNGIAMEDSHSLSDLAFEMEFVDSEGLEHNVCALHSYGHSSNEWEEFVSRGRDSYASDADDQESQVNDDDLLELLALKGPARIVERSPTCLVNANMMFDNWHSNDASLCGKTPSNVVTSARTVRL